MTARPGRGLQASALVLIAGLALAGCDKVGSVVQAAQDSVSGARPPASFLDQRLRAPTTFANAVALTDYTVGQVETYYGGPGGPTHWRAVGPASYALDVKGTDALTHKSWTLTLLFAPANLPEGAAPQLALAHGETFAQITRGLQDGQELDQDDIEAIESKIEAAKLPLPPDVLQQRTALVPACDGPAARAIIAADAHGYQLADQGSLTPSDRLLALSDITQTNFDPLDASRNCTAIAQLDFGTRLITYWVRVRDGQAKWAVQQAWPQPKALMASSPTAAGSAADSAGPPGSAAVDAPAPSDSRP